MDEVQTYAEGGDNHIIDTMVPWRKAEEDRMERFQIWLGSKQGKALINKMLLYCCKPKNSFTQTTRSTAWHPLT